MEYSLLRDAIWMLSNYIANRQWKAYGDYGTADGFARGLYCLAGNEEIYRTTNYVATNSDAIWINTTYNIGKQWRLYGYILNGVGPTGISCFDCNDWLGDSKWSIATK